MEADTFAERLEALAPRTEDLLRLGLSREDAEMIRSGYRCRRLAQSNEADPLIDLCSNFDISRLEVSAVTLHKPEVFEPTLFALGEFQGDPIVYSPSSGDVSVRDHEDVGRQVCTCAITPGGFLQALLLAAKLATEQILDPDRTLSHADQKELLKQCHSSCGGGSDPFCRTILGLEDV